MKISLIWGHMEVQIKMQIWKWLFTKACDKKRRIPRSGWVLRP